MSILKRFPPGYTPRPVQEQMLREVEEAFDAGHKFVILEGPPGVGKSLVAMTAARHYGATYVCTLTKQLQAQYLRDFECIGAKELKGKASFECERAGDTCAVGSIRFKRNPCEPEECPYKVAKEAAFASPITLCNYSSYLFNVPAEEAKRRLQGGFSVRRPLLVLDEAHCAEEVLMDFIGVTITADKLPVRIPLALPKATDVDACFEWLAAFLEVALETDAERLTEKAQEELEHLIRKASFALKYREAEEWIGEEVYRTAGFALKPLTVRSFGERLFHWADKVLLMSATVLDAETLAESLGIPDYVFVQAPCPFPVENRPVVVGKLNMTKAYRDESWPQMVKSVEAILDGHSEEKGLLLTPSNEMLTYLEQRLPARHSKRLVLAYGPKRMDAYQHHLTSPQPTVLAASGLWEGADLKGEFSRFQILPAVPRPFWGGQIAARGKSDPRWYRWRTYCQLIQGLGRSIRSETDFATSYVLDGDLAREAARGDTMLPPWFIEALEYA